MLSFSTIQRSIALGVFGALLLPSAVVACGGGSETTAAQGSSSSAGSGGGGGQSGQDGGNITPCPPATICLDVKLLQGQTTAGRLGVIWIQLDDYTPTPAPLVAYDMPFDPGSKRVEIPIASLALPKQENLFCQRACSDEVMCPCLSDPKVGFAIVAVVADADANGKLDPGELQAGLYGAGYMVVGYSATAIMSPPAPYFDMAFPEGIDKDVRPYRIIPMGAGVLDALGRTKDGDVFDLNVCPSVGAMCKLPLPRLT